MAPPRSAELEEKVLLAIFISPKFWTPPPPPPVEFIRKVLLIIVNDPAELFEIPPPPAELAFPDNVLFTTVSPPVLSIPPPRCELPKAPPFLIVRLFITTYCAVVENTRTSALLSLFVSPLT